MSVPSTKVTSIPNRGTWAESRSDVIENSWRWATMWSPAEHRPKITPVSAAMPDADASAASAPSRDATACSNSCTLGLPKRE